MKDDYGPAMNWYKCAMQNLNLKDEENVEIDPKLEMPVLMVVSKGDPLSNQMGIDGMKAYAPNLKTIGFESGHWIQVEKKDEVNSALEDFFKSVR